MPWRRRCSPRALAAQVAYDAPPLMSILHSSGGFSERQLQSVAVLLDVVYPLLPWSSLRSTSGDVSMKEGVCMGISPAAYEKRVQNMLVSVSEAAPLRLRRPPTHS